MSGEKNSAKNENQTPKKRRGRPSVSDELKMKPYTFKFRPSQLDRLREYAKEDELTISILLRRAVTRYLKMRDKKRVIDLKDF